MISMLLRRRKILALVIALIACLISACVALGDGDDNAACLIEINSRSVSFTKDVQPLLVKSCVSCHTGMQTATEFRAGYYPAKATARINLAASDSRHMPPGSTLSSCNILKLEKWETGGFAN